MKRSIFYGFPALIVAGVVTTAATNSFAALITSFESPAVANGANTFPTVAGFTGSGSNIYLVENPNTRYTGDNVGAGTLPGAADGAQTARIVSSSTNNNGSLTSNASLNAALGLFDNTRSYTLSVATGNPFPAANQFNGAIIELFAGGGTPIATATLNSLTNAASFANLVATSTSLSNLNGINGAQLTVVLRTNGQGTTSGANVATDFDNVRLTSVVIPEPASAALLAIAGFALFARRRA